MIAMSWNKTVLLEYNYQHGFVRTPGTVTVTVSGGQTLVTTRYSIVVGLLVFD